MIDTYGDIDSEDGAVKSICVLSVHFKSVCLVCP